MQYSDGDKIAAAILAAAESAEITASRRPGPELELLYARFLSVVHPEPPPIELPTFDPPPSFQASKNDGDA